MALVISPNVGNKPNVDNPAFEQSDGLPDVVNAAYEIELASFSYVEVGITPISTVSMGLFEAKELIYNGISKAQMQDNKLYSKLNSTKVNYTKLPNVGHKFVFVNRKVDYSEV